MSLRMRCLVVVVDLCGTLADCPGGSLSACINLCPADQSAAYKACIDTCLSRCSDPSPPSPTPTPGPPPAAKTCIAVGDGGTAEAFDCDSPSALSSLPQTASRPGGWVIELDDGLALLNGDASTVTLWRGEEFKEIDLGSLDTPVGGTFLDGKLYVACFGSWPTPGITSGLAVIDVAGQRLEATHSFPDTATHVHNAYSFEFGGRKEIFVAALGNPWVSPALPGKGLVRFDRTGSVFKLDSTGADLSVRSAKQQADGSIFVLTQEPAGQATQLARLEERDGQLVVVGQTQLPARPQGGDGGADVVLGALTDSVWVTDRQANAPGKLYYYTYAAGAFTMVIVRDTGVVPRYTVALENGDIIACNHDSNDLSVFKGLALRPTDTTISEQRLPTVNGPMFFLQTDKVSKVSVRVLI